MYTKYNAKFDNDEILNNFTDAEKDMLFSDLTDMYFRKNFGTISKADFETYLFSFYIEHLLDNGMVIDDYIIGRDLGLTQSRVRTLKERKELKYPRSGYKWQEEFIKYAKNAKYDESTRLIKVQIPDVNVIKDIRYFFEKNNEYDEYQLNPKLFQCRPEAFVSMGELIAKEQGEEFSLKISDQKALEKALGKEKNSDKLKDAIKDLSMGMVEKGLKGILATCSKTAIYNALKYVVPGGNIAIEIYDILKDTMA